MTDTTNRPPLWREMIDAYAEATGSTASDMQTIAIGTAAEILAVRDWLKGQLPEGGAWHVLLTAEADRAERGE